MARLAGMFAVVFLLFTFSHAHFLTVDTEHDVTTEETVTNLPESNSKATPAILLPSEKSGVEPAKVVDSGSDVDTVPLTMINFHPVKRRFDKRPLIPFFRKRNCGFHRRFRPLNPPFRQNRDIRYGDDMILSDERTRFDPDSRGVVRQIQARWVRFPDDRAESNEDVDFIKPHHNEHDHEHGHEHDHDEDHHHHHHFHHHRRHHHGEEEEEKDEREEDEHENQGGFMRSFRKFLVHF